MSSKCVIYRSILSFYVIHIIIVIQYIKNEYNHVYYKVFKIINGIYDKLMVCYTSKLAQLVRNRSKNY